MTEIESKLALGTANFGLNYGISNVEGKLAAKDIENILNLAFQSNVNTIDTAQAYGDSESRLGQINTQKFQFVTKIGVDVDENYRSKSIQKLVTESLGRLKLDSLNGVLLHRPEILLGNDGKEITSELRHLKENGLVKNIGVSIYGPELLDSLSKVLELDIVQAPFNVFDQRILTSGWSDRLKERGTKIHTRSIFLQGLLLLQKSKLDGFFVKNWPDLFANWFAFQNETGVRAETIALDFGLRQQWIDKIVVGVDTVDQLSQLLMIESLDRCAISPQISFEDEKLLNPSNWRLK